MGVGDVIGQRRDPAMLGLDVIGPVGVAWIRTGFVVAGGLLHVGEAERRGPKRRARARIGPRVVEPTRGLAPMVPAAELADVGGRRVAARKLLAVLVVAVHRVAGAPRVATG